MHRRPHPCHPCPWQPERPSSACRRSGREPPVVAAAAHSSNSGQDDQGKQLQLEQSILGHSCSLDIRQTELCSGEVERLGVSTCSQLGKICA